MPEPATQPLRHSATPPFHHSTMPLTSVCARAAIVNASAYVVGRSVYQGRPCPLMCKVRNALGEDDWIGLYEKAVRWCLGLKSRLIVILVILVCFVVSLFRCLVVRSSVSVR